MPGLCKTTECMSLLRNCQFDCYNVSSLLDRGTCHLSKADLFAPFQWCRTHGKQSAQAGEACFLCRNRCRFRLSRGKFIYLSSLLVTFCFHDAVQVWINMSKSWITVRCYSQDLGYAFLFLALQYLFIRISFCLIHVKLPISRKADYK
jgi:hypothetical protein